MGKRKADVGANESSISNLESSNHLLGSKGFEPISRRILNADGANDVEGGLRCLATQTELWGAEAAKALKRRAEKRGG